MMHGLFDPPKPPADGKKPQDGLQAKTGVTWPCRRDPRLIDLLETIERERSSDDCERLMWVLCAAVWQLNASELDALAKWFENTIRPRAGCPSGEAA